MNPSDVARECYYHLCYQNLKPYSILFYFQFYSFLPSNINEIIGKNKSTWALINAAHELYFLTLGISKYCISMLKYEFPLSLLASSEFAHL